MNRFLHRSPQNQFECTTVNVLKFLAMRLQTSVPLLVTCILSSCSHPSESTSSTSRGKPALNHHVVLFNGANANWHGTAVTRGSPHALLLRANINNLIPGFAAAPGPDVPTDRLLIGQGLNSATGEQGALCVAYDPDKEASELTSAAGNEAGQKVSYVLQQVTSIESLKKAAKVDASASFGWGVFSSDATASLISSGEFTQYNNFVYAEISVYNAFQALKSRNLRAQPALAWAKAGPDVFVDHCGDEYIYGRQTGGDFAAIIQFSSTNESDQQTVSGAINIAIAPFGGGSADFMSALQKLQRISTSRVMVVRNGGMGDIPDVADLVEAVRKFPDAVKAHPVVIGLATDSYKNVDNIPRNVTFGVVTNEARTLAVIAGYLDQAYQNRANLTFIIRNPTQFVINSPADLTKAWNENEQIITDQLDKATSCHDDAPKCGKAPAPPSFPTFAPQRTGSGPESPPKDPQYDLRWVTQDEHGRPYAQTFVIDQYRNYKNGGYVDQGSFYLTDQQGSIQSVDYTCDDTPNSWVCGNDYPWDATFTDMQFGRADFKRGYIEILGGGLGFNFHRKLNSYNQNFGANIARTDHWVEKYVAHYAKQQRVCVANCPH